MRRVTITRDAIGLPNEAPGPEELVVAVIWAYIRKSPSSQVLTEAPLILTASGEFRAVDPQRDLLAVDGVAVSDDGRFAIWSVLDPPELEVPRGNRGPDFGIRTPMGPLCPLPEFLPRFGGVRARATASSAVREVTPPESTFNASARALAVSNEGDAVVSTHHDNFLYHRVGDAAPTVTATYPRGSGPRREIPMSSPPLFSGGPGSSAIHISPDCSWVAMTVEGGGRVAESCVGVWSLEGEPLFSTDGRTQLAASTPWSPDSRRLLIHVREEVTDRLTYRWKAVDVVTGETEILKEFDGVGTGRERPVTVPIGFADNGRLFVERVYEHRLDLGVWERGSKPQWLLGVADEAGRSASSVTPTRALLAWA